MIRTGTFPSSRSTGSDAIYNLFKPGAQSRASIYRRLFFFHVPACQSYSGVCPYNVSKALFYRDQTFRLKVKRDYISIAAVDTLSTIVSFQTVLTVEQRLCSTSEFSRVIELTPDDWLFIIICALTSQHLRLP